MIREFKLNTPAPKQFFNKFTDDELTDAYVFVVVVVGIVGIGISVLIVFDDELGSSTAINSDEISEDILKHFDLRSFVSYNLCLGNV